MIKATVLLYIRPGDIHIWAIYEGAFIQGYWGVDKKCKGLIQLPHTEDVVEDEVDRLPYTEYSM